MPTCPTCRTRYPEGPTTCEKDGETLLPDAAFSGVDADLPVGRMVGEYRIEGKLGEGGFGTVYRAVHPLIGKAAAVKVLSRQFSANPQMVTRFIAEARAVNQIRHRNIIDIFSFGSLDDGRQYFVMELLEGSTLDAYLKSRGRLTPEEAVPILRSIARALDAAHAREIAHRDLKPENIFLATQDGEMFPKLLDFGIAKLMGDAGATGPKTNTGVPIGTPYYMSPEQCRGRDVDHRTDVYSFGIMAHELLTGQLPHTGGDTMEILMKQMSAAPAPMSAVCPAVPPALDAPVLAMLEKDPAKRPATLGAAVEALANAAREAGFSVPAIPTATAVDSSPRVVSGGGSASHSMVNAATVSAAPVQTFQGTAAESSTTRSKSSRAPLFAVAGVVLLGVIGGTALLTAKKKAPDVATGSTGVVAAPPSAPLAATAPSSIVSPPPIAVQSPPSATAEPNAVAAVVDAGAAGKAIPAPPKTPKKKKSSIQGDLENPF